MNYLKRFQNHNEYEAFVSDGTMIKPNVSRCVQENEVHYNAKIDYSKKYLTFISLEDNNTFYWNVDDVNHKYSGNPILYSLNNGKTWNSVSNGKIATINSGNKILLKAVNSGYGYNDGTGYITRCRFSSTNEFNVYGNVLSMIYGDDFTNNNILNDFFLTFEECSIVSAENLILPSEFGENGTIGGMFRDCTSLIIAPELPATTLSESCYSGMFQRCTSLVNAPVLPATMLAIGCYQSMFQGCTSLTVAPELPATTLTYDCYRTMFAGCTSLTTAPELSATTLASSCYASMFNGCTNLTTEAIVPNSVTPIGSIYCANMYCGCSITTRNGNYDELAYSCDTPK